MNIIKIVGGLILIAMGVLLILSSFGIVSL